MLYEETDKFTRCCHRNQQPSSECDGDDDDIDPKLKDAILKSRKLDRILQRKLEQEKNVKRERMQLHCRCVEFYVSLFLTFLHQIE